MKSIITRWWGFSTLLVIYKCLLDFVFLPVYYRVFSYMTGAQYQFSENKYLISWFILISLLFVLLSFFSDEKVYTVVVAIILGVCIIPMLSVYAFVDYVDVTEIIYPMIYWSIVILLFLRYTKNENIYRQRIRLPRIKNCESIIFFVVVILGLGCWVWAGAPLLTSLSDSITQRIALRENSMPTILGYIFTLSGGAFIPYYFARYLDKRKIGMSIFAFIIGFLLYSVNGLKTWLFLYLFAIALYVLCEVFKDNPIAISCAIIGGLSVVLLICVGIFVIWGKIDFISQFGRVVCIPNGIGFKSINFFKQNELLYLRESLLKNFFQTPYVGGSDFYIDYGSASTITSSRSNNGLWGDAYRNFGLLGMFLYSIGFAKIIDIVRNSLSGTSYRFTIFILFLSIWNAVNVSLFTWLLTGGVIVLIFLNKMLNYHT